nr:PREDICTED: F-box only protein 15 isoform X2 [Bos indicus]
MAIGRGRLLQLQWQCLLARPPPLGCFGSAFASPGAAAGRAGFRMRPGAMLPAGPAALSRRARQDKVCRRPSTGCSASLDSLPSEVLLKILSYLDAAALLCAGCVNRRFYHLANDNFIWIRIYSTAFSPRRSHWRVDPAEKTDLSVNLLSAGDKEAGYWKKEYLTKQIASVKAALARVLKPLHPHTGLPVKTKEALRVSGLGWVIILRAADGREYTMEHADLSVNDSSVTVVWYGKDWPPLATLSTLDLCGATPVFMGQSRTPSRIRPRWHSLITKYQLSQLTESSAVGGDRLMRVFCLPPGLVVGLWKREEELAFVMANLHLYCLVERSMLGSPAVPYELPPHTPVSDDSPERGLHGYRLHVDMHSGGASCLCGSFHNLSASKELLYNGPNSSGGVREALLVLQFPGVRAVLPRALRRPQFLGGGILCGLLGFRRKAAHGAGVGRGDGGVLHRQPGPLPAVGESKPVVWDTILSGSNRWQIIIAVCFHRTNWFCSWCLS